MALTGGDAQGYPDGSHDLTAKIMVHGAVVAECNMNFDKAHIGEEIKMEMLNNESLGGPHVELPDVMRYHLQDCILVFCYQAQGPSARLNPRRDVMKNDRPLYDYEHYLDGREAWLELHEPGADITDGHPPNPLDFGVPEKKGQ